MDNLAQLVAQLRPDEFEELQQIVFTNYNQTFRLLSVTRMPGKKVAGVRLHSGATVTVDLHHD